MTFGGWLISAFREYFKNDDLIDFRSKFYLFNCKSTNRTVWRSKSINLRSNFLDIVGIALVSEWPSYIILFQQNKPHTISVVKCRDKYTIARTLHNFLRNDFIMTRVDEFMIERLFSEINKIFKNLHTAFL